MEKRSYKLTFRINASHSSMRGDDAHAHTFEISLIIQHDEKTEIEPFDHVEKRIKDVLDRYRGTVLNQQSPFDVIPPTIENMGDSFFAQIGQMLEIKGYYLSALTISQTPQQVYEVTAESFSTERLEYIMSVFQTNKNNHLEPLIEGVAQGENKEKQKSKTDISSNKELNVEAGRYLPNDRASSLASNKILFLSAAILIVGGFALMMYVRASGYYPLGLDVHGHLFKSDLLLKEIMRGEFYPLFTPYWYNGLQPFRYWAPLPYYLLALLQFLGGGPMESYLLFVWVSFSVGGAGWLLFAKKTKRPYLGLFIAVFWFFMPENLRVFFGEGNVPRMFFAMVLPFVIYCLWQFVFYARKKMLVSLILLMPVAVMGHLMIAAMLGIAAFVYLLFFAVANKAYKRPLQALLGMFFSFFLCGIWLYPALVGGMASMSSEAIAQIMILTSVYLKEALNPLLRFWGEINMLYFGISVLAISLIGVFLSNKKAQPGFITFIFVVLTSTTAVAPFLLILPLSQMLWMRRFTPIAYALFLLSILEWKSLKKVLLVTFCAVLFLDGIATFSLGEFDKKMNVPATVNDMQNTEDDLLLTEAKAQTQQRVSLMDLSHFGPMPSYTFGTNAPQTEYVFGWAWQGAVTAPNIAYLNEALEKGNYLYMFDRNLELGADAVIIDKRQIRTEEARVALEIAASSVGYVIFEESEQTILFIYPVEGRFGLVTDYSCLAIGTTAALVPGILPYYHPGDKLYIDEYTLEELMKYEKIYLSGFFYNDRVQAESLVRSLAQQGVEIFIDMSRIPADPLTNRMTFLDISAQPIAFANAFPVLVTEDHVFQPKPFSEEYEIWNTVYLNGLEEVSGYAWFENSPQLDFIGTGSEENITFIGFNILFHAYTAEDDDVKDILNRLMTLDEDNLPQREVVPIEVEYGQGTITIRADRDNVNTTLAYQDIFESESPLYMQNNFLFVDKGTTVITYSYPYLWQGFLLMFLGIVCEAGLIIIVFRKSKKQERKKYIRVL